MRDIDFVHAYIVYQLLSRRTERDLLLMSSLLASSATPSSKESIAKVRRSAEKVDSRLYPAVVKLLDTVLQSLEQMRTLSIVDESADITSAVDARIAYIKGQR